MPNIYTDGLEHLDLQYSRSVFGKDAMKMRNQKASKLRKEGWTVEVGSVSFQDLARDSAYWIRAKRAKK